MKDQALAELMDADKLERVRSPKMVINDTGLSGSDKAFKEFVKPPQIYFPVSPAHGTVRFIPAQHLAPVFQIKS